MAVQGMAYSVFAAALWPSVPYCVSERHVGTAYVIHFAVFTGEFGRTAASLSEAVASFQVTGCRPVSWFHRSYGVLTAVQNGGLTLFPEIIAPLLDPCNYDPPTKVGNIMSDSAVSR